MTSRLRFKPLQTLGVLAALLIGAVSAQAQIPLFWSGDGTPQPQGWLALVQGTPDVVDASGGQFRLDTMADAATQHGFMRFSPVALDTATGFQFTFSLRVDADSISSPNRGGFSLIVVGHDPSKALELVFRQNEVFSYDYVAGDPDRFVHGAGVAYTAGTPINGVLTVANNAWTLNLQGQNVLGGSLVDYRAQGNPYTLPDFLFFGDDTSRAAANVVFDSLVISAVPEPAAAAQWLAGLAVLSLAAVRARRRAGQG